MSESKNIKSKKEKRVSDKVLWDTFLKFKFKVCRGEKSYLWKLFLYGIADERYSRKKRKVFPVLNIFYRYGRHFYSYLLKNYLSLEDTEHRFSLIKLLCSIKDL